MTELKSILPAGDHPNDVELTHDALEELNPANEVIVDTEPPTGRARLAEPV